MCLSFAKAKPQTVSDEETPFSFNEITSAAGNKDLMGTDYKKKYEEMHNMTDCYKAEHKEANQGNESYLQAELMTLPTGPMRQLDRVLDVSGSLSWSNTNDTFYFIVSDRMTVECRFIDDVDGVAATVSNENREELFDVYKKNESLNTASALLKKGAYYLSIKTSAKKAADYKIRIRATYADTYDKLKLDEAFMKKYKALVWESDYVPGAVKPIDGTVIAKSYKPGRSGSWSHTGRFVSGELNKQYLYRSTYIWTQDAFDALINDVNLYENKALEVTKKASNVVAKWSAVSTATGLVSFFVSFFDKVGGALGQALGGVSLATSFVASSVGNGVDVLDASLIHAQCQRIKGALDACTDGTIISFKEAVFVRSYTDDSKYTKRHYQKIKCVPYVNDSGDNKTYSVVDRKVGFPCPTYDVYLHHNADGETVSDCQGTFKAYKDYRDIKPLVDLKN